MADSSSSSPSPSSSSSPSIPPSLRSLTTPPSTTHHHHTWARTFHSRPELYFQPSTTADLRTILAAARLHKRHIALVGSGHSPSDLTCTSAWLVNLDNYARLLHVDRTRRTVRIQAGMRLHQLNSLAREHGLTIPNLGSIDAQSVAGAIATGTHGSSLRHGLLSDCVRGVKIMLAGGAVVWCYADGGDGHEDGHGDDSGDGHGGTDGHGDGNGDGHGGKDKNAVGAECEDGEIQMDRGDRKELFRAALLSLGALGIIIELDMQLTTHSNIEWHQSVHSLSSILSSWHSSLWTQAEFVRIWWLPYSKRGIVWTAERTEKALRAPPKSWYGGALAYYVHYALMLLSYRFPRLLPTVEWFVFGMQYGFRTVTQGGKSSTAVQEQRDGLLMDCMYSQFVNEWAIPLDKGPEVLSRLSAWLNHEDDEREEDEGSLTAENPLKRTKNPGNKSGIPFSSRGVYVHAPVEVRVTNTTDDCAAKPHQPRPFLDPTAPHPGNLPTDLPSQTTHKTRTSGDPHTGRTSRTSTTTCTSYPPRSSRTTYTSYPSSAYKHTHTTSSFSSVSAGTSYTTKYHPVTSNSSTSHIPSPPSSTSSSFSSSSSSSDFNDDDNNNNNNNNPLNPTETSTTPATPTLYLNATLYRPWGLAPPCMARYYAAFEYLMRELGGRPHWAKNFGSDSLLTPAWLRAVYGRDLERWLAVRWRVDPEGMFVGGWVRRVVLGGGDGYFHYCGGDGVDGVDGDEEEGEEGEGKGLREGMRLEEREEMRRPAADGGVEWFGRQMGDD